METIGMLGITGIGIFLIFIIRSQNKPIANKVQRDLLSFISHKKDIQQQMADAKSATETIELE